MNSFTFENSVEEENQDLLPLITSLPGFENIEDIEMSGLAPLTISSDGTVLQLSSSNEMSGFAETIFSDDTILRLSGVTGGGSDAEDDFVAGCGEWFGCVGVVQAYDSLTTPPLISSTMLEPERALSPSDSTMGELVADPLVGGAPADWMDSTLLLNAELERILDATTVLLGASTSWESFSLDASTERLMDGVLESTNVWDSMTLDVSTERLLDAGPVCKYLQLLNVTLNNNNNNISLE